MLIHIAFYTQKWSVHCSEVKSGSYPKTSLNLVFAQRSAHLCYITFGHYWALCVDYHFALGKEGGGFECCFRHLLRHIGFQATVVEKFLISITRVSKRYKKVICGTIKIQRCHLKEAALTDLSVLIVSLQHSVKIFVFRNTKLIFKRNLLFVLCQAVLYLNKILTLLRFVRFTICLQINKSHKWVHCEETYLKETMTKLREW